MISFPAPRPERVGLLVVGGGPAALFSAKAYREQGGTDRVVVISDDDTMPYFRPALSKEYLRGDTDEDRLGLEDPGYYAQQGIELRLSRAVARVDAPGHTASLFDGTRLNYRSCVLATGARPTALPVPGAHDRRVAYLRSRLNAQTLRAAVRSSRRAVVIGSGFIGCEAAASMARQGVEVTVVSQEQLPQQGRLGQEAGERIAGWLGELGVRFIGGAQVEAIEDARLVRVAGGEPVVGDLVLVATGVSAATEPVVSANVRRHDGRVVVDEQLRADVPDLYAAGDVAYARNASAGRNLQVEHWGEAQAMGAIAGANAAGQDHRWDQVPGFWSVIGDRALKYAAWGDGFDQALFDDHGDGFTVWYLTRGRVVGVLTHNADEDYQRGRAMVERSAGLVEV